MTDGIGYASTARTVLVYDRPLFAFPDGPAEGQPAGGAARADLGAHGFDQLFTSAEAAVDVFVGSARSPRQYELAAAGTCEVRADDRSFRARFVASPPERYRSFSRHWSDEVLWLVLHGCWSGTLGEDAVEDFRSTYEEVNRAIAAAVLDEIVDGPGSTHVFWQDYQLWGAPRFLREAAARRGLPEDRWRSSHFNHVPFPPPERLEVLPRAVVSALVEGLLGNDAVCFQTERDRTHFLQACRAFVGAEVDWVAGSVRTGGRTVSTGADPFPLDRGRLDRLASLDGVQVDRERLQRRLAGRRLVLVVGRVDPVKDLPASVRAYGDFLGRVRRPEQYFLLVQAQPSRTELERWRREVERLEDAVAEVNARFRDLPRPPIGLDLVDDMSRAVAAYRDYDVLDVAPVADGLNLVSLEGIALNRNDGVVVLSESTGAADLVGASTVSVRPRDHESHVSALLSATGLSRDERRRRSEALRSGLPETTVVDWFRRQRQLAEAPAGHGAAR